MKAGALLSCLAGALMSAAAAAEPKARLLSFADLDGWANDDHAEALSVFASNCDAGPDQWSRICQAAQRAVGDARGFFETNFRPVLLEDGEDPLFTAYYEPEIDGSPVRTERHLYPLHRLPPEVRRGEPWLTRAEIETSGVLLGRGLELAWLSDPVDKFFLQVQGSGRIRFPDGDVMRVGFGGRNGHPYSSVGRAIAEAGYLPEHGVSAQAIRAWVAENPELGAEMLRVNASYIFFRRIDEIPKNKGPLGAMNRPLTPMRSIAVDRSVVALGTPVWIEKDGADPVRRLMMAEDTGAAINGAQRADLFYGTGEAAGEAAGIVRDPGRMVLLLPEREALARTAVD